MSETNVSTAHVGVMVAPNGARLTPEDHPAIPVTVPALVDTVVASAEAGAVAVHLHARDEAFKHVLDAEQYSQSIALIKERLGDDFPIQVTTEAVGVFTQQQQIDVIKTVVPEFASVALVEVAGPEQDLAVAREFYHWCVDNNVGIQHILYAPDDLTRFLELQDAGVVPQQNRSVLFVLGRYTKDQQSDPAALDEFLIKLPERDQNDELIWTICAFGSNETECLLRAASAGGHCRVGFENNRLNADGQIAASNEERVSLVCQGLAGQGQSVCDRAMMREILGGI